MRSLADFREDQYEKYFEMLTMLEAENEAFAALPVGFGKTAITLAAIAKLRAMYDPEDRPRVLVVSTTKIIDLTWGAEIEAWDFCEGWTYEKAIGKRAVRERAIRAWPDVLGVNFENLCWLYDLIDKEPDLLPDILVIDESSRMKDPGATRVKRHCGFGRFGKHGGFVDRFSLRIALSATPNPEGYVGLWSQEASVSRQHRLGRNITSFRAGFCSARWNGVAMEYEVPPECERKIDEALAPIMLTSKYDSYLDLPDPIHERIDVPWKEEARDEYRELEKEFILDVSHRVELIGRERGLDLRSIDDLEQAGLASVLAPNLGVLLNKLRQACSGFVYDAEGNARALADPDAKLRALAGIRDRVGDTPLVVFTQYRAEAEAIVAAHRDAVVGLPRTLDDWNRGRIPMLVLHPRSAGHGINLQYGSNVAVWYALPWSYEEWHQANGRLHRTGQTRQVSVLRLSRPGSVELDVWSKLQGKHRTLARFLNAIRERTS